jgi:hypothetical protein
LIRLVRSARTTRVSVCGSSSAAAPPKHATGPRAAQ